MTIIKAEMKLNLRKNLHNEKKTIIVFGDLFSQ